MEIKNSSLKDQLNELQERLDDTDSHQLQIREVTFEEAGMSRTSSESQNQLYDNSHEAVLLDKCKGIEYNIK